MLLGADAAGLSATNIARLTAAWEEDYRQFRQRDLADRDYVYVWSTGSTSTSGSRTTGSARS